ncbi:MAG: hypothetical protein JNM08_03930 [Rubrivivax sp.]|nr:hypothetical protein [Rubrivivax sp.]
MNGSPLQTVTATELTRPAASPDELKVHGQRLHRLEEQLRGLLEQVRGRNEEIGALTQLLSALRPLHPDGKLPPPTGVVTHLGGPGTGGVRVLDLPSDFKPKFEKGSAAEPYANALSDFIDAGKAKPVNYEVAVGSNGQALTGFLKYLEDNQAAIDARFAPATFKPGFNGGSDSRDIEEAFKSNPGLRKEYESYLRLAIQGGGTAAPPGTPILDPRAAPLPPTLPPVKPGFIAVPSDFKPDVPKGSAAQPYAAALSDFIDAGKAKPASYALAAGGHGEAISGFLKYVEDNRKAIDAHFAPATFNPGFNGASDLGDIDEAFKSNPGLRKEYESYLRLAIQGGGTAAPPDTPIVDTRPPSKPARPTPADVLEKLHATLGKALHHALEHMGLGGGKAHHTPVEQLIKKVIDRLDGLGDRQQLDMHQLTGLAHKRSEAFEAMARLLQAAPR